MKPCVQLMALILSGIFAGAPVGLAQSPQAGGDKSGYQFLERLVSLLVKSVAPGGGGDAGQEVVVLARDLKVAHAAKRVDDLFNVRYSRLLSAIRQGVLQDPEVLYWPMYRFAMMDFIEERTGQMPEWKEVLFHVNNHGGSGVGLALLADAIMSDVVSLHIHLDTLARRPEIRKDYMEKSMKAAAGPAKSPRQE